MTKDTNKENALKVIRYIQSNVEGLKELREGCKGTIAGVPMVITAYKNQVYWFLRTNTQVHEGLRKSVFEESFKIIGHEPQLNHLLLAINKTKWQAGFHTENDGCTWITGITTDGEIEFEHIYDLTKTVQENLESNPELTNYLINLFGL